MPFYNNFQLISNSTTSALTGSLSVDISVAFSSKPVLFSSSGLPTMPSDWYKSDNVRFCIALSSTRGLTYSFGRRGEPGGQGIGQNLCIQRTDIASRQKISPPL